MNRNIKFAAEEMITNIDAFDKLYYTFDILT